jgi:hypothetical protein
MATAAFVPDLATGMAGGFFKAVEPRNIEELSADELSTLVDASAFIRGLFADSRRNIEAGLCEGVEATAFASKYERGVGALNLVFDTVERIVKRLEAMRPSPRVDPVLSNFKALYDELTGLRHFLLEALAKAKTPPAPINWTRIREVEAAYSRGETRPM